MDNLKDYEVKNALYDLKFDYDVETDLLEESLLNVCELRGIAEVLDIINNKSPPSLPQEEGV